MFCPKCGFDVGESKFCPECKKEIKEEMQTLEKSCSEEVREENSISGSESVTNRNEYNDALKRIEHEKAKKRKIGCFIPITLLIVLLVVRVVCVNNRDETETVETSIAEASVAEEEKVWNLEHYVDDYGEILPEYWLIAGYFDGTFSNSATTDSECSAKAYYDYNDTFAIFLYKYGTKLLKNCFSHPVYYTVKYKDCNGKENMLSAYYDAQGDRLAVEEFEPLLNAIKEGDVKVYIVEKDDSLHNYRFTIKSGNFAEIINNDTKN